MQKVHGRAIAVALGALSLIAIAAWWLRRNEERDAEALARAARERAATLPAPPRPDTSRFVTVQRGQFTLGGKPYRFLGVNTYTLAAYPRGKGRFTCGKGMSDAGVDRLMKEAADMGMNVVRFPAYQSLLRDPKNFHKLDFARFDNIVAAANAHGIRLIVPLESQWGHCTMSSYKWAEWYAGGYKRPYGEYRLSYRDYVAKVVARYKDEPAILMWQLMNEAESRDKTSLQENPEALQRFVYDMAALVERYDPNHLLSPGAASVHTPGSGGPFYAVLHQVRAIDAVELHDYDHDDVAVPADVRTAIAVAAHVRKPFYIGEVGVAHTAERGTHERARLLMRKVRTMWASGVQGIVIWSYRAGDRHGYDFWQKDPLVSRLRAFSKEKRVREGE